jgi:DNA-binding response OmpR family regulator
MAGASGYNGVTVLIGETNLRLAEAIQKTLGERGLSNVLICGTGEALTAQVRERFVDLLVIDHILPGIDLVNAIQQIRRNTLGANPFATIIATIGKTEAGSTRAAVDAGVDDIVPKPLTADRLMKTVSALTQAQRSFIVAPDYVGPTRRKEGRIEERGKVRSVPNTLYSRIVELAGDRDIRRMVARAAALISDDRFEQAIIEIDHLVTRIVAHFTTRGSHETLLKDLKRLIEVSEMWRAQYEGPSKAVVENLGGMLIALAERVLANPPGRSAVEVGLLGQLNQAVRTSIDVDRRDARYFAEITKIVKQFTNAASARS